MSNLSQLIRIELNLNVFASFKPDCMKIFRIIKLCKLKFCHCFKSLYDLVSFNVMKLVPKNL